MRSPRGRLASMRPAGGASAGLIVLATSMAGHIGNYLFYVVAARQLGPERFAEVTAITALGTMSFLPFSGVQAALARDVAALRAGGEHGAAAAVVRWTAVRMLAVQSVLFALLAAGTPLAAAELGIEGSAWLVGASWLALGIGLQVLMGPLQGYGRFTAVGLVLAGPMGLLRLVLLVPLGAVAGVEGALGALVLATVIGLVATAWTLRGPLRRDAGAPPRRLGRLGSTVAALVAFASLTNVDVVLAKAQLSAGEAGLYATAALLGKIAFHGPSALALVLLPTVTQRLAVGASVTRPMLGTLAAVLATGLGTALAILLAPAALVTGIFGTAYAQAYPLTLPLALVMTAAAVLYVHLMLALAGGDRAFLVALGVTAVAHVALVLTLGTTPRGIVVATAIAVLTLLVWHEVASPVGTVRLLRAHGDVAAALPHAAHADAQQAPPAEQAPQERPR